MEIHYTTLSSDISAPTCAHQGDAGLDLRSNEDACIQPQERLVIGTGICMALPEGLAGLVVPRSGLAAKHGISIVNAPGLIDSGYRGEIKVILLNTSLNEAFTINKGDRIAQLLLVPYVMPELKYVNELESSSRGDNGFGSSGIK